MQTTIEQVSSAIRPILERHGVRRAGVFGSLARGQMRRRSDVDVVVELASSASLFDFIGLKQELEEALGRKVDLVEYTAIRPLIRERVLKEHVAII